ncbi:hypothetical protein L7F22_052106 [Adiantum nelumboides]|nr:hypothetical protein [Adiantum nelumboides]
MPGAHWSDQQVRCSKFFEQFGGLIEYVPGKANPVTDALSRKGQVLTFGSRRSAVSLPGGSFYDMNKDADLEFGKQWLQALAVQGPSNYLIRDGLFEKAMEHLKGIAYTGSRGMGLRMIGLGQGSLAPGIMGPGRPLMPIGMGSLAQGFNPFGGLIQHGRPQVHLQEVLAQEHLLRAHALQLAQETLATAIRSPLTCPLGAAAFQPFVGYDVPGPRSHSPKHFLRPMPDLVMGPMGSFARGQRPSLPAGRAGLTNKVGGQADTSVYNGIGRQFGWPGGLGPNEALKRSCGRGRDFCTGLWGDVAECFGHKPGGVVPGGHSRPLMHSVAQLSLRHLNPDNTLFCQTSPGVIQAENELLHNGFDARWKIEKERRLRSGLSSLRTPDNSIVRGNTLEGGRQSTNNSEKDGEIKLPRSQDRLKTSSLATRLGPPAHSKVTTSNKPYSAEVPVASNVIKLHQPVRKSRILKVSGLPEDTPISTVVEVFEKLGKITMALKNLAGLGDRSGLAERFVGVGLPCKAAFPTPDHW